MRTYEELVKEAIEAAKEKAAAETKVTKFEVGKTYYTRSACDHNCIFKITVLKRTEKTVVVMRDGKESRCKISVMDNEETIKPWGVYSMCPIIRAGRVAA